MRKGDLVSFTWDRVEQLGLFVRFGHDYALVYSTLSGILRIDTDFLSVVAGATLESIRFAERVNVADVRRLGVQEEGCWWVPVFGTGWDLKDVGGIAAGDLVLMPQPMHKGNALTLALVVGLVGDEEVALAVPALQGGTYRTRRLGDLYACFPATQVGRGYVDRLLEVASNKAV